MPQTNSSLSEFLETLTTHTNGAATQRGSIVFVSLARNLDRLIRKVLSLGPYHRGTPSPWSHTFLLAEDYHGPDTAIIDCTIRTTDNRIAWDEDHGLSVIDVLTNNSNSGICSGVVADYDDHRVGNVGVKWIPELSDVQRDQVVAAGDSSHWVGVRYDIPGLFRELLRLMTGDQITVPYANRLLFCSAFVQAVYRSALGAAGDFNPTLADEDTTPDDIWYRTPGKGEGPVVANPDALF